MTVQRNKIMLSSEDEILIKTGGSPKDFLPKDSQRNSQTKKMHRRTLDDFQRKLHTHNRLNQTHYTTSVT